MDGRTPTLPPPSKGEGLHSPSYLMVGGLHSPSPFEGAGWGGGGALDSLRRTNPCRIFHNN